MSPTLDLDDAQFWSWCQARDLIRKYGPALAETLPPAERRKIRRWLKEDRAIIEQSTRRRRGGLKLVKR